MKTAIIIIFALAIATPALAKGSRTSTGTGAKMSSHSVRGHVTKRGTYVAPHRQSTRDSSKTNNWSTKGNTNPYTGKPGSR